MFEDDSDESDSEAPQSPAPSPLQNKTLNREGPVLLSDEENSDIEPSNQSLPKNTTTPLPSSRGPVMFYSDSDSEDDEESVEKGGTLIQMDGGDDESDNETSEDYQEYDEMNNQLTPDNMSLKPVNPFLRRLRRRDPVLFMSKPTGKYKAYSVSCQPTSRHPVILTKDEMDRTDKSAYTHAIKYGSDTNKQHYFICPRFWCFLTNSAISEEDVKSGKCGKIIKKDEKVIPKGSYVYELNKSAQIPGFIEDARADGKCLPCCFKKTWDNKTQSDARKRCELQMNPTNVEEDPDRGTKRPNPKKQQTKTLQYIYSLDTYPIPSQRWGFLPIPVQLFFQIDYRPSLDPNNPALLKPGKDVFLRYGVEQPMNQSFLGCFADIYAHRQGLNKVPTIEEFRQILGEVINLDVFVSAHNGSLLSAFFPKKVNKQVNVSNEDRKKYKDTEFALALDLTDKAKKRHLDDAILAYENFIAYIKDPSIQINHQYLWDFVCDNNRRIIPKGLNLVILEIKANDIIDRIELVCPTNLYSRHQYDTEKDTVILLKHDEFYEPIYMYESVETGTPKVTRFFSHNRVPGSISDVLKHIENSTRKYCPGLPSLPKIYRFGNPIPIQKMLSALVKIGAKIESQVVNYQGKTIGLLVLEKGVSDKSDAIYVPCAPSARLKMPVKYMDSLDIPKDYEKTVEALNRISSSAKIPCKPIWKIKEDAMVVGFLTETNQFVPIKPNEDIIIDDLRTYEGVDTFAVDKAVATEDSGDKTRIKMTKFITLESQFYHAFRNRVRILLNQFANRSIKTKLRQIAEDMTLLYAQKIEQIEPIIENLIYDYIVFVDIEKSVLMDMVEINECDDIEDSGPNCIIKENGVAQLVIPKWHLISKYDNETIYIGRMADELVRNDRIKSVMYDTKNRLHSKTTNYQVKDNEFILVQSALTPEYFSELDTGTENDSYYAKQTNYELANPSISITYPNEKISIAEQYQDTNIVDECLVRVSNIIGNRFQVWERIFADNARELVFRDNANCTFKPIIRIVQSKLGETWTVQDTKNRLATAYSSLFETDQSYMFKIAKIMREQGKSTMFARFVNAKSDLTPDAFQDIVMNEEYYLTDMDIWVLANAYNLPIVVFNANGLKGFFPHGDDDNTTTTNVNKQWIKMGGEKGDKYHFIRSKIRISKGSYANHIYDYHLIIPEVKLSQMKEFQDMVMESTRSDRLNTARLEDALSRVYTL